MRRGTALSVLALALAALLASPTDASARRAKKKKAAARSRTAAAPSFDPRLPILGTKLAEFPPGPAKTIADQACLGCHSVDIVAQQRLTEKQWGAELTKMAGWGADFPADRREELLGYLVKNFGPDAAPWEPVVTRPTGR